MLFHAVILSANATWLPDWVYELAGQYWGLSLAFIFVPIFYYLLFVHDR